MKKILLTILCLTLISSFVFANTTPFVDVEITSSNLISCDRNKILGSITVTNSSELYSPELYYVTTLSLLKPVEEGSQLTSSEPYYQFEPIKFDLGAYEEKTLYFDYKFPKMLPYNQYALSIEIYSDTTPLSTVPQIIHLGDWGYDINQLTTNSPHYWKIGNEKILPDSGPTFKLGETPIGVIELTANNDFTAQPEFTVYKRLRTYEPIPIKVEKGNAISFKANETKKVELKFPTFKEPESYEIYVRFLDENGNQVSQELPFRYVLSGASAKILSTNASYDTTTDSIKIDINTIGPADSSELENCSVIYRIYNLDDNSLIKEKNSTFTLTENVTKLEETIANIGTSGKIKIEASIIYGNVELTKSETTINLKRTIKSTEEQFIDLVGTKYYDAVKLLNGLGILNGYPDGTFKPANNITRAEFTVIATKLAKLDSSDIKSKLIFSDIADSHWAKDFIILAYENEIIKGYPDGTFKADNNVTYQEALTILLNVMNYQEDTKNGTLTWPDNYIFIAESLDMMKNLDEIDYTAPANRGDVALLTMEAYIKLKEI